MENNSLPEFNQGVEAAWRQAINENTNENVKNIRELYWRAQDRGDTLIEELVYEVLQIAEKVHDDSL